MDDFRVNLTSRFLEHGFKLTEIQVKMFSDYYSLLIEWNNRFNLTAITNSNDVIVKHFIDSVLPIDSFKAKSKLIDIGSGAGFPGVPIKIMRNDLIVTLLDPLKKRTVFLDHVVNALGLESIKVVNSRAEPYARLKENREKYNYCVSRAVAKTNTLLELSAGLVSVGGEVVLYKSNNIKQELKDAECAASKLGLVLNAVNSYELVGLDTIRNLVFYKKNKTTPSGYPRGKDKPRKSPL